MILKPPRIVHVHHDKRPRRCTFQASDGIVLGLPAACRFKRRGEGYCQRHRDKFVALNKVSGSIASLPGIITREGSADRILIASSTFDRVCGGTAAANLVKTRLDALGLISVTGTGAHRRFAMKHVIAGQRVTVINISADLMAA